jgi:hypothetical protein
MTTRFGDRFLKNSIFSVTRADYQIDWSGWSRAGHDQTGHKSLKTHKVFLIYLFIYLKVHLSERDNRESVCGERWAFSKNKK